MITTKEAAMRDELIFSYNNTRCHAQIVEELEGGERYIGKLDGYELYQIPSNGIFHYDGFVAIKKD